MLWAELITYSPALGFCGKNTNFKHQITAKSQIPIVNDQNLKSKIGKRKEERG
jgi:hypothetical protein